MMTNGKNKGRIIRISRECECRIGKIRPEDRRLASRGLHCAIIGLENHFSVILRVAVLHRFYCIIKHWHCCEDVYLAF